MMILTALWVISFELKRSGFINDRDMQIICGGIPQHRKQITMARLQRECLLANHCRIEGFALGRKCEGMFARREIEVLTGQRHGVEHRSQLILTGDNRVIHVQIDRWPIQHKMSKSKLRAIRLGEGWQTEDYQQQQRAYEPKSAR